ncbi:red chlorophyll catabolite reductase-like [Dioscorea cayenensis subsp. rotundata]|uniref:Red chlorophyll catabolite reductase-like n=1 Tax=Dioscorea cayennensis subsp. rotundata TaxID=55577 RepID=A0AB40BH71_DIOCR|nr:red chlorophyll catabolite reductase-like [Dioscorea cayenensis subsp. rotundata]
MLVLSHQAFLHPPKPSSLPRIKPRASMSRSRSPSPVLDFPYLPPPHRDLMLSLLSTVHSRLASHLLPSSVPSDVLSFHNDASTSFGALDIRSGAHDSPVDFILESWLHCKLPTGALNITTLFGFLNASTEAPHLLMEFIQGSPTSLVLFMDLLPRKDLVLHPEYLAEFYQDTQLEKLRQELNNLPYVQPYCSSSLYIRSVLSPTAVAVNINCGADGESSMEEVMGAQLSSVAKEVLQIWLDKCACSSHQMEESKRNVLIQRDNLIKTKTVEIDLSANLPRMFGPNVAEKIVGTIQKTFRI